MEVVNKGTTRTNLKDPHLQKQTNKKTSTEDKVSRFILESSMTRLRHLKLVLRPRMMTTTLHVQIKSDIFNELRIVRTKYDLVFSNCVVFVCKPHQNLILNLTKRNIQLQHKKM